MQKRLMIEKEGQGKQCAKAPREEAGIGREGQKRVMGDRMMGEEKKTGGAEMSKLERNWQ